MYNEKQAEKTINEILNSQRKKEKEISEFSKLFKKDQYRSIIILTGMYDKGEGLKAMHHRWYLIKNHDEITPNGYRDKQMKDFFSEPSNIYYFFNQSRIKPGCITSKTNLAYFLNKLLDLNILKINRTEDSVNFYSLSEKGIKLLLQETLIRIIRNLDLDGIKTFFEKLCTDTIIDKKWFISKDTWKNNMKIDYDKITVVEMQGLSEFFNIHCDGDKQAVIIDGVVK